MGNQFEKALDKKEVVEEYNVEKEIKKICDEKDISIDKTGFDKIKGLDKLPLLLNELNKFAEENKIKEVLLVDEVGVKVEKEKKKDYEMPERIKTLLESEKLWNEIVIDELNKKHIGDIETKEIIFMCCIGRFVKNKQTFSYNNLVLSMSSAGKDHLVGSVLKIFNPEDYETWGRTSTKTFNYLHNTEDEPDWSYNGKIVYLKEITEGILNSEVMKEFTSAEEEITQIAIPRPRTKLAPPGVDIVAIKGHPVVICTTATSTPSDEIRNRFNIVGLDESKEQTKRSRKNIKENYSNDIKEFLDNLQVKEVEIPDKIFKFIDDNFPTEKVRYRRDFYKFVDFVRAKAVFNQNIRMTNKKGYVIATEEDYNSARDIFTNAYSKLADIPLKEIPKRIVAILEKQEKPMSAKEICDALEGYVSIQGLYPHLHDLKFKEILDEITNKGEWERPTTQYILSQEFKDKKPFKLPLLE